MNILYFLIALFFTVPTASFSMNQKYQESPATIEQKKCPRSPLNSDEVMQSLFSREQIEEHKTSYEFKKPERPSEKHISVSPHGSSAQGTGACNKAPVQDINLNEYAVCNYAQCKVIVHQSYAKAHLVTHLNNDPSYRTKERGSYYTAVLLKSNKTNTSVIKHEITLEPTLTKKQK